MNRTGLRIDQAVESLRTIGAPDTRPRALDEVMEHHRVPGVSLAVVERGEVVEARSYGVTDAEAGTPVGESTLFQAASVSKPVSCTAMLRLVQDGRLDLDADANTRLTSWQVPRNDVWPTGVTLRRIASHSAGLTVHGFPGYRSGERLPSVPQILDGAPPANTEAVRVADEPGRCFRYSGGGTMVLQQVLQDTTGMEFEALVQDLVLDPLGMEDSTFAQPLPTKPRTAAASGHGADGAPLPGRSRVYPEQAAAGLWTTAVDLARFLTGIQHALATPYGILDRGLARDTLVAPLATAPGPGYLDRVGVGFFHGARSGARYLGHDGSNAGFRSLLVGEQDLGWGLAVMANGDSGSGVIEQLVAALADALEWPAASDLVARKL